MKKYFLSTLFFVITFMISNAQVTITYKPGLNLNGANIGYKKGKVNPYFGLQFVNINSKYEDNDEFEPVDRVMKTHVFMPYIGSKFYVVDKESIKGSLNVTLFKPLIFGKETDNGEVDESFADDLKELKVWGGELGYGTEYFFDEHFSIGGEFGFRFGFYKDKYESSVSDYAYSENLKLNMTYISASMNFYF